jgi:hypothetical protein
MSFKDLREAETKADGADAIDRLAQLVADRYPKGTTDPYGKALRHQLHKLGRLNEPESLTPVLQAHASAIMDASTVKASDFESGIFDAEDIRAWQLKLARKLYTVLHSEVPSGLFEARANRMGRDAHRASLVPPSA